MIGWWAAVGTDGMRLVVWGLGKTLDETRTDARLWLVDADGQVDEDAIEHLSFHVVSDAERQVVLAGDCSWPISTARVA